jgi:hypothetical protein
MSNTQSCIHVTNFLFVGELTFWYCYVRTSIPKDTKPTILGHKTNEGKHPTTESN